MAKITSKLQITIPKRIAEQYGLAPGDEIELVPAGDVIHLVAEKRQTRSPLNPEERLRLFDAATARQLEREREMTLPAKPPGERDWNREDLYRRGQPR